MCILLISPILTAYVHGYDTLIYLVVLWVFSFCFLWRTQYVISKWNTWLFDIRSYSDQEILDWNRETYADGDLKAYENMTAPAALELSRSALYDAVHAERSKPFWVKSTRDKTVRNLAKAYPATLFLLKWYSRYMQTNIPLPYPSTWNLQIKIALGSIRNTEKGLRLHDGFIHWRYASRDIACGILYFLVALLDRWIELICGGRLIGLTILKNPGATFAICLGLVYYLFGAVVLGIVAERLYQAVKKSGPDRIQSLRHLGDTAKRDAPRKQKLYWGTLGKFFCFNGWGFAASAAIVWAYIEQDKDIILFLAYTFAYSGLLWFQYNNIYAGPSAVGPLAIAFVIGVVVGFTLHFVSPQLFWNDVICLAAATWTAGLLTFRNAKLGAPQG